MRKLPLGVAVSAALHVAAVAWIGTRVFPIHAATRTATTPPIELISLDPRDAPAEPHAAPEPLDVLLVPQRPADRTARTTAPAATRALARPVAGAAEGMPGAPPAAIVLPGVPPGVVPGAGSSAEAPPAHSRLAMRRGDTPSLELPHGRWDDLDRVPRGTGPEAPHTTGILRESGGGTYRSDQGVFTGKVHRDGSVDLKDHRNLNIRLALPSPRAVGRALARWYESDKGSFGAEGDTSLAKQIQATSGTPLDPEGGGVTVILPVVGGSFDTTDWLMRRNGQDPYASKKLAFLDATRDERVEIGKRHRAQQFALTPQIVQRNLEALWAATQGAPARKRALFELWDECVESGEPQVVAAAQAARRLVIGFIRARLPAGSADAYTPAELAELARTQQSKAVFAPYE